MHYETSQLYRRFHVLAKPKKQDGKLIPTDDPLIWWTGRWTCALDKAQRAIGAEIHLHEYQNYPSWMSGWILDFRPSSRARCVDFLFKVDPALKRAHFEGWNNQQARVLLNR